MRKADGVKLIWFLYAKPTRHIKRDSRKFHKAYNKDGEEMVKETEEEMKEIDKLYKAGMKFIVRKNGNFYAVLTERAKE